MSREALRDFLRAVEHHQGLRRDAAQCRDDDQLLALARRHGFNVIQQDLCDDARESAITRWFEDQPDPALVSIKSLPINTFQINTPAITKDLMAVVTLLSDFIDGTSMALAEDTDAADLNAFMTANQGRLWASVQQRRRQRQQTIERRGPGTVYFAADAPGAAAVERYLGSETGSAEEAAAMQAMRSAGVEIAPHVGADRERDVLLNGRLKDLTAQAKAKEGFWLKPWAMQR